MRITPTDLTSLAKFILSPDCQSICVLTGAGVSVASGIPDFRSPGGMYDTLRPELITATAEQRRAMERDQTEVVSWDMFQANSFPYLEVRRPFILGTRNRKWKATITHRFMELLHTKTKKLSRIYTQNIDGLQQQCERLPADRIVNVHGSIGRVSCENCGHEPAFDQFCDAVKTNIKDIYDSPNENLSGPPESTPILCEVCQKPFVKPSTVLFGRSLPSEFFMRAQQDLPQTDLLIVAGTSLLVSPANSLVYSVPDSTIRVVVNQEPVGRELGIDYSTTSGVDGRMKRDYFAQGDCDTVFLDLIEELGWLEDLKENFHDLPPQSVKLLESRMAERM